MIHTPINLAQPTETQLYSDAVVANGMVFTTGQMPVDAEWNLISEELTEQASHVFDKLAALLKAAGSSPASVVKLTIYLTDVDDISKIYELRQKFLGDARPASVVVQVPRFGTPGMKLEMEAVATLS